MARPTKLTPDTQKAICKAIRHSATYQAASEAAGIDYATFNRWMNDERPKYRKFCEAVRRANADAQLDIIAKMEKAGENDWRHFAWILEHRYKKDYGNSLDMTTGGEKLNINLTWRTFEEDKKE